MYASSLSLCWWTCCFFLCFGYFEQCCYEYRGVYIFLNYSLKFCFSFFKKYLFNWRLITLQYCAGPCHTLTWISHGCTCLPPSWSHLLPPFTPIPLGCPRALALSALLHASHLHWSSILHMVMYMFQCCSLKSSHPHLLPHSPKVCSLHLCLFCCLAYTIVITIFLNSICISVLLLVILLLTYFTLYNGLQFHPPH